MQGVWGLGGGGRGQQSEESAGGDCPLPRPVPYPPVSCPVGAPEPLRLPGLLRLLRLPGGLLKHNALTQKGRVARGLHEERSAGTDSTVLPRRGVGSAARVARGDGASERGAAGGGGDSFVEGRRRAAGGVWGGSDGARFSGLIHHVKHRRQPLPEQGQRLLGYLGRIDLSSLNRNLPPHRQRKASERSVEERDLRHRGVGAPPEGHTTRGDQGHLMRREHTIP